MITSTDGGKASDKTQRSTIKKKFQQIKNRGKLSRLDRKALWKKKELTTNIVFDEKIQCFLPDIRNQSRMSSRTTPIFFFECLQAY